MDIYWTATCGTETNSAGKRCFVVFQIDREGLIKKLIHEQRPQEWELVLY